MANPASAAVKPRRVRYKVRNGTTKVPNLLRNTPPNRIQIGRGNDRSVVKTDSSAARGARGVAVEIGFIRAPSANGDCRKVSSGKQKTLPTFRWAGWGNSLFV